MKNLTRNQFLETNYEDLEIMWASLSDEEAAKYTNQFTEFCHKKFDSFIEARDEALISKWENDNECSNNQ